MPYDPAFDRAAEQDREEAREKAEQPYTDRPAFAILGVLMCALYLILQIIRAVTGVG